MTFVVKKLPSFTRCQDIHANVIVLGHVVNFKINLNLLQII